jgi:hypothetical protein
MEFLFLLAKKLLKSCTRVLELVDLYLPTQFTKPRFLSSQLLATGWLANPLGSPEGHLLVLMN